MHRQPQPTPRLRSDPKGSPPAPAPLTGQVTLPRRAMAAESGHHAVLFTLGLLEESHRPTASLCRGQRRNGRPARDRHPGWPVSPVKLAGD